jgi:hypothetical protein
MAFAEDFATLFNTSDFATAATVGGVAVNGIFDNDYAVAMGFAAGTSPVLLVASASVLSASVGTAVTLGAVSYTVAAVEPDGTGVTLLRLQEA